MVKNWMAGTLLAAAVVGIGLLFGAKYWNKPKANESGITWFHYCYSDDYGGSSFFYTVETGEKNVFSFDAMEFPMYGTMTREVDDEFVVQLDALCRACELEKWDGFNECAKDVLDGDGFELSIRYTDGGEIHASGSNSVPKGYSAFWNGMKTLFGPIRDELLEEARQAKIAEGIHGTLEDMLVHFTQRTESGIDEYQFLLLGSDVREKNVDVRIHSASGEFLPAGDYRVYEAIDDSMIDFERVQKLIEDYDVIEWYNYNKTSAEYPNRLWFQVGFGYDSGDEINAYGTEPPPNYEAFRKDFLKLMIEMLEEMGQLSAQEVQ